MRDTSCGAGHASDLFLLHAQDFAGNTVDFDIDVGKLVALQAPAVDSQGLASGRITFGGRDRGDLGVSADGPAIISSPVAVLCRLSDVCVANSEAHLGFVILTRVLITDLGPERVNFVLVKPRLVVNGAL